MNTKRIFISYKRANRKLVDEFILKLSPDIQDDCWVDTSDINYSTDFESKICKAIDMADAFLFMYSKEHTYLDDDDFCKDWTIRELNYAEDRKKKIWFISIDNTDLIGRLKFRYATTNLVYNNLTDVKKLNIEIINWLWQEKTNTRHLVEAYQNLTKCLNEIVNHIAAMAKEEKRTRRCPICDTEQENLFQQSCFRCNYIFPSLYGIWPDRQLTRIEEQEVQQFRELWRQRNETDAAKAGLGVGNDDYNEQDYKATNIEGIDPSIKNSSSQISADPAQINSEAISEAKDNDEYDDDTSSKSAASMDAIASNLEPVKESEEVDDTSKNSAPTTETAPHEMDDSSDKANESQDERPIPALNFEASLRELNSLLAPPAEPAEQSEVSAEEEQEPPAENDASEQETEAHVLDLTRCNDDLTSMFNLK